MKILGGELQQAKEAFEKTGRARRVFKDFTYRTRNSLSRERRVVGKAEHLAKVPNPRFVVTSLSAEAFDAKTLYEVEYCGLGNIKTASRSSRDAVCRPYQLRDHARQPDSAVPVDGRLHRDAGTAELWG